MSDAFGHRDTPYNGNDSVKIKTTKAFHKDYENYYKNICFINLPINTQLQKSPSEYDLVFVARAKQVNYRNTTFNDPICYTI